MNDQESVPGGALNLELDNASQPYVFSVSHVHFFAHLNIIESTEENSQTGHLPLPFSPLTVLGLLSIPLLSDGAIRLSLGHYLLDDVVHAKTSDERPISDWHITHETGLYTYSD